MRPQTQDLLAYPPLVRALDLLDRDGEQARLVGGAVRNALLGRLVADHDIATTATPDVVMARAAAARIRAIPTGVAHGTVTLMIGGRPLEVTTLREDVGTDGRHATVRFGRDFAVDARRRDFTINALSLSRDGTIHDYAGGLDDLAARRVRFIGDAATRIREDYLRILRFLRFSAEYAAGLLDDEGLAAAIRQRAGLSRLSRERVRQELLKLLAARRAVEVVTQGAEAGLLGPLLRSVPQPRRLARLLALAPDAAPILRLAALAAIVPDDAARLRACLALSNAETTLLEGATLVLSKLRGDAPPSPRRLRTLLLAQGRDATRDGLILATAEARPAVEPSWRHAIDDLSGMPDPVLPFSGADLLARGIAPGKAMGEMLARLEAAWIDADCPSDPDRLAALLDEICKARDAPFLITPNSVVPKFT